MSNLPEGDSAADHIHEWTDGFRIKEDFTGLEPFGHTCVICGLVKQEEHHGINRD